MDAPNYDPANAFDLCVAEIRDDDERQFYIASRNAIKAANVTFDTISANATWFSLPRAHRGQPDQVIAGTLTKIQLMDLYTLHMVGSDGPARDLYDDILTAAGGFCPFCGGLGHARTLDHYLPKAVFPSYSVHPSNLVPCCRDCNSGKNSAFGQLLTDQTLHPYFETERFFNERWIHVNVTKQNPILFTYECVPSDAFSSSEKDRLHAHFSSYNISSRFSIQAGAEISKVLYLRRNSLSSLSKESFRAYLTDNSNSNDFTLNGWSRPMYYALSREDWFCETDFNHQDWSLPAITPIVT